jgi:hypothetical protein
MTRRPEQQIQKAVLEHLKWRGVPGLWWCHYPAGGARAAIEARIFKSLGVQAGVPDILIVRASRLFALELKSEAGRLSAAQIETQQRLRDAGVEVATAYSLDAALAQLEAWELLHPDASNKSQSFATKSQFAQRAFAANHEEQSNDER